MTGLDAHIGVGVGGFDLDINLRVQPGEVLALLGPNGAGKTTALRSICGLQRLHRGVVRLDSAVFDQPERARFVPPEQRRIGVVFQDHLLFAHLSVLDNVAFGLRAAGAGKAEARRLATERLRSAGLDDLQGRRPAQLSGGEAQRVALLRALATAPNMLLLDEPLAALDATTRQETRRALGTELRQFAGPTVLVTHDPIDAISLADRVAVVERGRLTQTGTLSEVTGQPATRYVADLLGVNLIRCVGSGTTTLRLDDDDGRSSGELTVADPQTGPTLALIAPSAVTLHRHDPDTSARNRWECRVLGIDLLGDRVRLQLHGPVPLVVEITPPALASLALNVGDPVWASVKATQITTYPVSSPLQRAGDPDHR